MTTLTVENYLKTTLLTGLKTGSDWVTTGQLATAMSVAPGTVTAMLKTLSETGHADYRPYEGVRLTETGRQIALRILRRHRLIELFLVKTLDLNWDEVHAEAENMEHAVSDRLVDRIDEFLGHPVADPHGDPIPSADGAMRGNSELAIPLDTIESGATIRIVRVTEQGSDFLRFLGDSGFSLLKECRVIFNSPEAGIVTTVIDGREVTLGHPAARHVLVERVGDQ
ncbi:MULTISPECIES: metal-dependent transcriptional regulator [unclassified Schlesneria]|uniref:metal-dependent transcriptional regulator n=1 Tax=Schlesneria TaxID=656899 RepID=UPI002EF7F48A